MCKYFNLYSYSKASVPPSDLMLVRAMMESLPWLHCSTDLPDGTWGPPTLNLWPPNAALQTPQLAQVVCDLSMVWCQESTMKSMKTSLVPCPKGFAMFTAVTDTFFFVNLVFSPEKDSNRSCYLTKPQKIQSLPGKREEPSSTWYNLLFVLLL